MIYKKSKNNKIEFSKLILISVAIFTILITILCLMLIFITKDLSPFMYLIPAIFSELTISTGFYYNKAKSENKIKLLIQAKNKNIEIMPLNIDE